MSAIFNIFKGKDDTLLGFIPLSKKSNLMRKLEKTEQKSTKFNPDDIFIKIDEKNSLNPIDEEDLSDINEMLDKYKIKESKTREATNNIMNKFLEKIVSKFDDIFTLSQNLAKNITKNDKIDKELIEKYLNNLINKSKSNNYRYNTLKLNSNIGKTMGAILSYSYSRLSTYKIKDMKKLIEARDNIIKNKIDILKDFKKACQDKGKDPKNEKLTAFCKDKRNQYPILPELIFLINRYSSVNSVQIELESFSNMKEEEYLFVELTILNLYWLLNSLNTIKFNFISKDLEQALYFRYNKKLLGECEEIKETIKMNCLIQKFSLYLNKWNFVDNFKLNDYRETLNEVASAVSHKSLDFTNNPGLLVGSKTMENKRNIYLDITSTVNNFNNKNLEKLTRLDIVKNNVKTLELIILSLYSLNNSQNNFNLELIMNDCFIGEFLLAFKKLYDMEWITNNAAEFHVFDVLLYNNVIERIQKFNIEMNSLDPISFDKLLNFLYYNNSITAFNLSLFSADISYFPEFIYKMFEGTTFNFNSLKTNNEECTYLFSDVKDVEEKILNQLFTPYIYHLSMLYEIIKKKNLKELGFNIDIPSNIINKDKYMNALFKFILNIFFYISKNKIKKFCLLSPNTLMDFRMVPVVRNLINIIDLSKNRYLEDLSLQMKFYNIDNISNFISTRLKYLNLGDLDINTLKLLTDKICSYNFNKFSHLEKLSIGLINAIREFNLDVKIVFEKLFKIKIENFISLNIFTNINIRNKNQYLYLLKILDKNWISEYRITFNRNSLILLNQYKNELNKLYYLVPHILEEKLLEDKDLMKLMTKTHSNNFVQNVNKNLDMCDESYWCLKYLFTKVYKDNLNNGERIKQMIFDILKYIYFIKNPKVYHINHSKNDL